MWWIYYSSSTIIDVRQYLDVSTMLLTLWIFLWLKFTSTQTSIISAGLSKYFVHSQLILCSESLSQPVITSPMKCYLELVHYHYKNLSFYHTMGCIHSTHSLYLLYQSIIHSPIFIISSQKVIYNKNGKNKINSNETKYNCGEHICIFAVSLLMIIVCEACSSF